MRYANNLVALALMLLIILSAKNTYDRISTQIHITGATDYDTATVTLFVMPPPPNDTITEPIEVIPSGTGGGGPSGPPRKPHNVSKKVILELDAPPSHTLYAGDEISVFIKLMNKGDFDLEDIVLTKSTNAPDVRLTLSKSDFDILLISGESGTILKIKSLVPPNAHIGENNYIVTINAEVGNFDYRVSLRFFVNLKERNYETRLETLKELQFADGLFNQTPECADIAKEMKGAWAHYIDSDYEGALSAMQAAIEACRDKITPPEEGEEEITVPKTGMAYMFGKIGVTSSLFIIFIIIILLLLLLAGLYYYLKRRALSKSKEDTEPKTKMESTFEEAIKTTTKYIREKNVESARRSYLQLRSIYDALTRSALPVSKQSKLYVKVINVHNELSRLLKKRGG